MTRYYDFDGEPITMEEWAWLFEARSNPDGPGARWLVARDEIGEYSISTVWIGLDHRFGPGPPLIFESLAGGPDDFEHMDRYSTVEEARAGHAVLLSMIRNLVALTQSLT